MIYLIIGIIIALIVGIGWFLRRQWRGTKDMVNTVEEFMMPWRTVEADKGTRIDAQQPEGE